MRLGAAAVVAVGMMASSALAHEDPSGCFETGPAIIVSVFRADGVTGVVGSVSQCETINYRATLQKAQDLDSICAFSGGTFKLTTPNGIVHDINLNVPCIGGNTGLEGCDDAINSVQSSLFPYTVSLVDVVGGLITATANYAGGVAHDSPLNTPGVAATTPKSTPVTSCNDNNLCTNDICDPTKQGSAACSNPPVVCNDDNLCTADTCNPDNGQCVFTPNVPCDDGSLCTSDACNPATGLCVFTPIVTCNDSNLCTVDTCNPATGTCVFTDTVTPTCNDNNACTVDTCNPATGLCEHNDNVTPTCDDNNACTADSCNTATGLCVHGAPPSCDDDNACTADSCNTTTGLCEHGAPPSCDDNNACTADSCNTTTGLCEHGAPPSCDDGDACTADSCNTTTGLCVHGAPPSCDDNDACTADSCNTTTGLCVHGAPPSCDDDNACTADSCNTTTGLCVHGAPPSCDDNNACTADSCNPVNGQCVHTPNVICNDNNVCTSDACNTATGQCVFTPSLDCNDNNVCTTDTCDPIQGCQHTPPLSCDDDNVCTDDSCNPTLGCQNVPNNNPACQGLDHFQCYEIKPFAFGRRTATVQDRFANASANLRAPNRLCAPSDKRGEDPTAPTDPEHLTGFPALGGTVRVAGQVIANQFGTVKLDLIRRSFLFVPTLKSLVGPAPDLTNPTTDHFMCYLVRRSTGEPRFQSIRGVTGVDQFGSHAMDLLRPRYFCAPANKNNESPGALSHTQGLLCYKARHRIRFPTLEPFLNNQFMDQDVTITRRMEFCVPSTVVVGD